MQEPDLMGDERWDLRQLPQHMHPSSTVACQGSRDIDCTQRVSREKAMTWYPVPLPDGEVGYRCPRCQQDWNEGESTLLIPIYCAGCGLAEPVEVVISDPRWSCAGEDGPFHCPACNERIRELAATLTRPDFRDWLIARPKAFAVALALLLLALFGRKVGWW